MTLRDQCFKVEFSPQAIIEELKPIVLLNLRKVVVFTVTGFLENHPGFHSQAVHSPRGVLINLVFDDQRCKKVCIDKSSSGHIHIFHMRLVYLVTHPFAKKGNNRNYRQTNSSRGCHLPKTIL